MKNTDKAGFSARRKMPIGKMLTSALPFVAFAIPGTAYAQQAVNTATITAPSGAIELDSSNNSATDSDTIFAVIVATDDSVTGINGASGATAVVNAFTADTINGVAASTANATLALAPGETVPTGLTFDTATGNVNVAAGTPAGTYSFDYQICESANPTNCEIATITVEVVAAPIVADPDSATGVNGATGATGVLDVLDGDTLNGAAADLADVDISVITPATPNNPGDPVPTLNTTTGLVDVPAGTPAGTYSIVYEICETLNPTNCSQNTATITVDAAPIVADPDSATGVNGATGATGVVDVLDGDTLNGNPATLGTVDITVVTPATPNNPGDPVPALNVATGLVDVPAGTPAGTYTITYEICEELNPTNCAQNTVTITVDASPIVATDDSATGINGASGGTAVVNAFTADTINGVAASTANATLALAPGETVPTGLTFDTATGNVDVAAGTPAGTYSFDYEICETLNPSNCQIATITVEVVAAAIAADADSATGINGATGATGVVDVLDGDTLNGNPATLGTVDITVVTPATPNNPGDPVPTLNVATGLVDVPAGTPAGTYTITYEICEELNPTNCAQNTVTITVDAAPIVADPDSVSGVDGNTGATSVLDVLDGDTLNGAAADLADVDISVVTPATPNNPGDPVPVLNTATGLIDVPAGTPAGTYTIDYEICETINPTNCSQNTATVTVAPSVDLSVTKDNGTNTVTSGDTITYSITVSNAGPDAATGAVLNDTPGAGITCPTTNPLAFSGTGAPAGGPYTVDDLVNGGITLGTIGNSQSLTVTYDCTVD